MCDPFPCLDPYSKHPDQKRTGGITHSGAVVQYGMEVECWRPSKGTPMAQNTRKHTRFPFIASAEVLAENNGSRLDARISDISVAGCYVDTINPLPDGTPVRLKIFNESQAFEAVATVVYSHTHLGMGLRFSEVPPHSVSVLRGWIPAAV